MFETAYKVIAGIIAIWFAVGLLGCIVCGVFYCHKTPLYG
ncbi:hypothetical protein SPSIL_017160 [Sporomusa silvacetica DSM 10669]|uniref:TMhelix containing protein n=1 Tax=Sporomusa silvacetica DSM 10669 TaxID=1123289 RepID=A0ABZ3IIR2_9FIRM|nr:hypothetical protein SPSIL_25690 [Sporomusa silvacetica DSM 10669]